MNDKDAIIIIESLIDIASGMKHKGRVYSDIEVIEALRVGIDAIKERYNNDKDREN